METAVILCYSRCLYCGRRTPHEVCHGHSEALNPGWWDKLEAEMTADDIMEGLRRIGSGLEPETCENGGCPVWEPGEWDRRQAEAAMTPEQRRERLERIQRGSTERRAARTE
jgi:hypothetical protein